MNTKVKQVVLVLGVLLLVGVVTCLALRDYHPAPALTGSAYQHSRYYVHESVGRVSPAESQRQFWLILVALLAVSVAVPIVARWGTQVLKWWQSGEPAGHPVILYGGMAVSGLVLLVLAALTSSSRPVTASGGFQSSLPNGNYVYNNTVSPEGCQMCHIYNPAWTGSDTPGSFSLAVKPFTSGMSWGGHGSGAVSPAYNMDTDGDGFTNGEELQDPDGTWVYNVTTSDYRDTAYASNPNDATKYPPPPAITGAAGLTDGQTISNSLPIYVALRYAALDRVVYSFHDPIGTEVYSYTAHSPALTNYANRFCLGTSPANTNPCAPWDPGLAPSGVYTVVVTAYDRLLISSVFTPQTDVITVTNVTITSTTRYVTPATSGGSDTSNDCTNNGAPCATVQHAVDQASSGEEVRIATGTYTDVSFRGGLTQTVYISKSVTLRGGYTTSNWGTADPAANPTTLNAQGQGRVIYVTGSISVTLEDLRLTGGSAANGGGLYIDTAQTLLSQNAIFSNTANGGVGGGVYVSASPTTLSHNTLMSNTAGYGGGVGLEQSDQAMLSGNVFISNTASVYGGGIRLNQSNTTLVNNVFIDNDAGFNGGGGVGVWQSQPALIHNTFAGNTSIDGAAVNVYPGSPTAIATLTNTVMVSQTNGTAIVADGGATAIVNGVLWFGNQADTGGSVTYGTTGTITVTNAVIGDPAFAADGYHLLETSAAIDRGVNGGVSDDLDSDLRPQMYAPDLGADEFVPVALTGVSVSGPTEGFSNIGYAFTAAVNPVSATLPITYTWQATDQTTVINGASSLTNTAVFTWTMSGSKVITVTATNPAGSVFSNYLWKSASGTPGEGFGFTFADLLGTGTATRSMVVGDVNGDGKLDVVLGYPGASGQVYVNDGGRHFTLAEALGSAASSGSAALGDLNGDGALDVALTYSGAPSQVYLNDGAGHFPVTITVGSGANARSVAVGDLDGNQTLDIVLGYIGQPAEVFLNNGAGSFTLAGALGSLGATASTTSVAVGDLNGDGAPDVVLGNYNQASQVYLNQNDGSGGLTVADPLGSGANTTSVAVGDMNGDGALDIVLDNQVHLNDGAGRFAITSTVGSGANVFSVAVGDVNGDGALDMVLGNGFTKPSDVYLNDGSGNFTLAVSLGNGAFTRSVVVGDFNGDGALDILLGNTGQPNQVYLNNGAVGFQIASSLGSGVNTYSAAVGDFDGDGALDVVLGNSGAPSHIYWNDGAGHFPLTGTVGSGANTKGVAVADLSGDGALDVVLGNSGAPSQVYVNDGFGSFALATTLGSGATTNAVAVGDFDSNGALDVVLGNSGVPSQVYVNDGFGSFTPASTLGSGASTTSVAAGDFDGDGALDIVFGNTGQPSQVYLNDGVGGFTLTSSLGSGASTNSVGVGDLNGDGALDVVLGNFFEPIQVYLNDGAGHFTLAGTVGSGSYTHGVAVGDVNGDGALDIVLGNGFVQPNQVHLNDGAGQFRLATTLGSGGSTYSVALGDLNGDGALDIVLGNYQQPGHVYLNSAAQAARLTNNPPRTSITRPGATRNANFFSTPAILSGQAISIPYRLYDLEGDPVRVIRAYYSPDGGGRWLPAVAASSTLTTNLSTTDFTTRSYTNTAPAIIPDLSTITSTLNLTPTDPIASVTVRVNLTHTHDDNLVITLAGPAGQSVLLANQRGGSGQDFADTVFDDKALAPILSGAAPFTGSYRPEQSLSRLNGLRANGTWTLSIADVAGGDSGQLLSWGLTLTLNSGAVYTYAWDPVASGFFGQSDNVVFRIEAYPGYTPTVNNIPVPYQHPYASAQTFPFRVRGTQVRVLSDTVPISNAVVYRLPAGQTVGGALMTDGAGQPFHTDGQGYLLGRGQLNTGDQLLALVPVTATNTYTLYYTNGTPTDTGVSAHTVTASGVQTLTVSAATPLYLFNLLVSLEWDSSQDSTYLDQLVFNLHRASEYFYDFTNGQMAFGQITVEQNADDWAYANVVIRTNNRLRPFAAQGGAVITPTVDPQHTALPDKIIYDIGQVSMGSTWNRYGTPGVSIGDDWAVILAHELSHYLLFHDDAYLGLDANGYLIPVDTCRGTAMGDLYSDPNATEFIADETFWLANCGDTLPQKTLGRNEWETMQLWYPSLITPTVINLGPSLMPFDVTNVSVLAPLTPTATLQDPTFYLDYVNGAVSSNEARAYLIRNDQYVIDLGAPFGGQNRVRAWGAQLNGRLCVFDRPQHQYGCEVIAAGDDRVQMEQDPTWNALIKVTPVNSTTLDIVVEGVTLPVTLPVQARLYPDLGVGTGMVTLNPISSGYSGTITLTDPVMAGNVQVWVNEAASELDPRREAIIAFSIGGNPGISRAGGGISRAGGGISRAGGGISRAGGGISRAGGAPLVSPDGQMIFFTENPLIFQEGQFYAIQAMAGLPSVPPGRTVIGQAYRLVATPGTPVITGSVSLQYLSNDVLVAGADENGLTIYFYDGASWTELPTTRSPYFNLVSAPSQGVGVYALMASAQIPLEAPGWNLFAYPLQESQPVTQALASIDGYYTTVYGYLANDTADPWKIYDVNVPGYVNDLTTLEFGHGYWISVTQAITLHLSSLATAIEANNSLPASPPDTFYGALQAGSGFTPLPGMAVEAWMGGVLCGQGLTQDYAGQIVYVVDVDADTRTGSRAGCGQVGRGVTFRIGGQWMGPTVMWDDNQPTELTLSPAQRVYLPVVTR